MNGIISILKPPGMTSSDVVTRVRRILGEKRVGHTGTLDPEAAGVLVVCVGGAGRFIDYMPSGKEYIAELTLGALTDTGDAYGHVVSHGACDVPSEEDIVRVLNGFRGEQSQIPPMYSALKRGGKKLYELARQGIVVEREARRIVIDDIALLRISSPSSFVFRAVCTSGTYIRTLCMDIAQSMGTVGYMSFLVRTRSGCFTIDDAVTLEELESSGTDTALISPEQTLTAYESTSIPQWRLSSVLNGLSTHCDRADGLYRVYCDRFIGIGAAESGELKLKVRYEC